MSIVRLETHRHAGIDASGPTRPPEPARTRRRHRKPRVPRWPAPAALRPVEWGKPDPILAAMVCRSLDRTMPATPWEWRPSRGGWLHSRAGAAVGWLIVASVALGTLAGVRAA